jgi:hypothetical protein
MAKDYKFNSNNYKVTENKDSFLIIEFATDVGATIPKIDKAGKPFFINPSRDSVEVFYALAKNNRFPVTKVLVNDKEIYQTNAKKPDPTFKMRRGLFKSQTSYDLKCQIFYCADSMNEVQQDILNFIQTNSDQKLSKILEKLIQDGNDHDKRSNLVLGVQKSEYKVTIPFKYIKNIEVRTFSQQDADSHAKKIKWKTDDIKEVLQKYDTELYQNNWNIENSDYHGLFHSKFGIKKGFVLHRHGQKYFPGAILLGLYIAEHKMELFFLNYKTNRLTLFEKEIDFKQFKDVQFLAEHFTAI